MATRLFVSGGIIQVVALCPVDLQIEYVGSLRGHFMLLSPTLRLHNWNFSTPMKALGIYFAHAMIFREFSKGTRLLVFIRSLPDFFSRSLLSRTAEINKLRRRHSQPNQADTLLCVL